MVALAYVSGVCVTPSAHRSACRAPLRYARHTPPIVGGATVGADSASFHYAPFHFGRLRTSLRYASASLRHHLRPQLRSLSLSVSLRSVTRYALEFYPPKNTPRF